MVICLFKIFTSLQINFDNFSLTGKPSVLLASKFVVLRCMQYFLSPFCVSVVISLFIASFLSILQTHDVSLFFLSQQMFRHLYGLFKETAFQFIYDFFSFTHFTSSLFLSLVSFGKSNLLRWVLVTYFCICILEVKVFFKDINFSWVQLFYFPLTLIYSISIFHDSLSLQFLLLFFYFFLLILKFYCSSALKDYPLLY